MSIFSRLAVIVGVAAIAATPAKAVILTGTGLSNTGAAFVGSTAGGQIDTNYTLTSAPAGVVTGPTVTIAADGFPIGNPWVPNSSTARWVGLPQGGNDSTGPVGLYTYTTSFTLTAAQASTLLTLTGNWSTDDSGTISLNGGPAGNPSPNFDVISPISITSGFVAGTNTLTFTVSNSGGGPTGLIVDNLVIDSQPVPLPATGLAFALGATGLAGFARRRRLA